MRNYSVKIKGRLLFLKGKLTRINIQIFVRYTCVELRLYNHPSFLKGSLRCCLLTSHRPHSHIHFVAELYTKQTACFVLSTTLGKIQECKIGQGLGSCSPPCCLLKTNLGNNLHFTAHLVVRARTEQHVPGLLISWR